MPLFAEPLHVGCPNLGNRERLHSRFDELLNRRMLSNDGPFVKTFESEVAAYLGVKHCITVCNATIGLEIAIRALDLRGEVILPSFTFPATAHALAWLGVTPVFCEVDPATHNIDPRAVERLITPRTTGILGVHLWGNACDTNGLASLADRHGLRLLFDAAHALGCAHRGQMIGNFGDAEVFSFHATKFVNAGEGGAIVTNNDLLAERMRRLRNFGLQGQHVAEVGTNAKMSELSAAMGLTNFESREDFIATNRDNFFAYREALADVPGIHLMPPAEQQQHNWQYVVADIEPSETGISRDDIQAQLLAENVLAKRYFWPGCHRLPPYSQAGVPGASLPVTESLCDRLLQLPTGSAVSHCDIAKLGDYLRHLVTRRHKQAA
jgi:dTDP-4-amino-4,6-dideoxygalactose transaminase